MKIKISTGHKINFMKFENFEMSSKNTLRYNIYEKQNQNFNRPQNQFLKSDLELFKN